jgi:hypothetical protein
MKFSDIGLMLSTLCFGLLVTYRAVTDSSFRTEWGLGDQLTINPLVPAGAVAAAVALFFLMGKVYNRKSRLEVAVAERKNP